MARVARHNIPFVAPAPPAGARAPARPTHPAARVQSRPQILPKRRIGWIWQILILGYSTFGRSFAYIGVSPLFIGEAYLAGSIVRNRGKWIGRFIEGCARLEMLPLLLLGTLLWGMIEVARPVLEGEQVIEAFRTCAFNYYPIFLLIGMAIGRNLTLYDFVKFFKKYAVFYSIYGIFFAALAASDIRAPWARGGDVPLLNDPALAPLIPVALLAMWPLLAGWWLRWMLLPISMVPMFMASGRGTIMGFLLGLGVIACGSKKRFFFVTGLTGSLLTLMMIIGPLIKGKSDRSETLDPIINLARIVATFDEDAAYKMLLQRGYVGAAEEMLVAKGTANWRKTIWTNAMNSLNTSTLLALGHGHGASVQDLTPDDQEIHTPHNFVIYALYYTGVIGLIVFSAMLLAIFAASYRIPDPSVRLLQMSHVTMMCMVAFVGNMFETPIAAVPFYLLSGICLGLEQGQRKRYA
jgi:hypothetical protein